MNNSTRESIFLILRTHALINLSTCYTCLQKMNHRSLFLLGAVLKFLWHVHYFVAILLLIVRWTCLPCCLGTWHPTILPLSPFLLLPRSSKLIFIRCFIYKCVCTCMKYFIMYINYAEGNSQHSCWNWALPTQLLVLFTELLTKWCCSHKSDICCYNERLWWTL
jgi:hypothetical protein